MKTTKKIFAAILAVMMIAMMIPFTVSAAVPDGPYTATYKCAPNSSTESDKVGNYTFSFFKIADLNKTTGEYTVVNGLKSNTAIVNAINSEQSTAKSQAIISACDTAYTNNAAAFGTAATTLAFTPADVNGKNVSLADAGIYYIYCTSKPSKVTKVTNSLISLPYFSNNAWQSTYDASAINLASKVSTSSVDVGKTADKTVVADNDKTVKYTLTASTAGSVENKITKYAIVDTLDNGLTFNESSLTVKLGNAVLTKTTDYTVDKNYTYNDGTANKTATFAVVLTNTKLNSVDFYANDTVTVTYTADVNDNARLNTPMPNSDGLVYGNSSETLYEPGETVNVFSYGMNVVKVDGNDDSKKLAGAEFTVYTDANATTPLVVNGKNVKATTSTNGTANFKLDGSTADFKFDVTKTYYVKETKAPANYNISDTIYTVTVGTASAYTQVNGSAIKNYPVSVPQTGGVGTIMFTIGGASLVLCAGVLFLLISRKKSTK